VDVSNLCVTRAHVLYVGRGNIRLLCRRVPSKTFFIDCVIATIGDKHGWHGVHHHVHPSCMEVAANGEKEDDMKGPLVVHSHIEITETLVRLYVFLAQTLDRCLNEVARRTYPEQALQLHLAATRAEMMEILSVNRVVKEKVEQECHRVLALSAACLTNESPKPAMMGEVNVERAVLKNKTMALSDLLAVFRAS
jgi:hypothetical protein